MKQESDKYLKVINILRKSKPVMNSGEEIENEVISRILKGRQSRLNFSDLIDLLFGWVYIGWVRRSLVTVCVILVIIFVYQQGVILRQINFLSNQVIITDGVNSYDRSGDVEKKIMMYKLSGRKFHSQKNNISEKEMNQLLESIIELQTKYEELQNLIEQDPELKSYIEKKLKENNRTNI